MAIKASVNVEEEKKINVRDGSFLRCNSACVAPVLVFMHLASCFDERVSHDLESSRGA